MEEEKINKVTLKREGVVKSLHLLVDEGYNHPDDVPSNHPVNKIVNEWSKRRQEELSKRPDLTEIERELTFSLEMSTLYADAGFSDPDYIDELANDFLAQDLQRAIDAELKDLAKKTQEKIEEISH